MFIFILFFLLIVSSAIISLCTCILYKRNVLLVVYVKVVDSIPTLLRIWFRTVQCGHILTREASR